MKNLSIASGTLLLIGILAAASIADDRPAAVPQSSLASMGFTGVQILSDDAGLAVRGKGTYSESYGSGDWIKRRMPKHVNGKIVDGKIRHGKYAMAKHGGMKRGHQSFKNHFNYGKNGHRSKCTMVVHNVSKVSIGSQIR